MVIALVMSAAAATQSSRDCYHYSCAEFYNLDGEVEVFSNMPAVNAAVCADVEENTIPCENSCAYIDLKFTLKGATDQNGTVKIASCLPSIYNEAAQYINVALDQCEMLKENVKQSGGVPENKECSHDFCNGHLCNGETDASTTYQILEGTGKERPVHKEL